MNKFRVAVYILEEEMSKLELELTGVICVDASSAASKSENIPYEKLDLIQEAQNSFSSTGEDTRTQNGRC